MRQFLSFWSVFGRSKPHFRHEGKIKIPTRFQKIHIKTFLGIYFIFWILFCFLDFFWGDFIFFGFYMFFWILFFLGFYFIVWVYFFFGFYFFVLGFFWRYETKSIWFCILNICISFHRISRKLYVLSIVAFCYKGMIHNVLLLHSSFHTH